MHARKRGNLATQNGIAPHGYFDVEAPNFTVRAPNKVEATITPYENDDNGIVVTQSSSADKVVVGLGTTTVGSSGVNWKTNINLRGWNYAWVQSATYVYAEGSSRAGGIVQQDSQALDGVCLNRDYGDGPRQELSPGQGWSYTIVANVYLMVEVGDEDTWVTAASTKWSFSFEAYYATNMPHTPVNVMILSSDCSVREKTDFTPAPTFPTWTHNHVNLH